MSKGQIAFMAILLVSVGIGVIFGWKWGVGVFCMWLGYGLFQLAFERDKSEQRDKSADKSLH